MRNALFFCEQSDVTEKSFHVTAEPMQKSNDEKMNHFGKTDSTRQKCVRKVRFREVFLHEKTHFSVKNE